MDYLSFFLVCVLFAILGFGTTILCGYNIYKIYSDIGSFILLIPLILLLFVKPESIEESVEIISNAIEIFVDALPEMFIGDMAGTVAAAILKEIWW
ncbi:hypothetical protein [Methanofollis tationis]|uniref:Uncharacterized protein n=1 Tax=Methanofollis tationis TaxID=81417 RepID=A0A7K4HLR7_9EURY|nr:hypothetical protein [Methanofollis tationis]NVO65818.1 hypothetical protein [Methanofollis tationis]